MIDIDEMFKSIEIARQKAYVLLMLPLIFWYLCFSYLWIFLLWDIPKSVIYTSPILIILYVLFYFKGFTNQYCLLTDEKKKFMVNWEAFETSKSPSFQEEFDEFLKENPEE